MAGAALKGNSGANILAGLDGNDKIYAYAGNDTVNGGAGNDWLEGGTGKDTYTGGTGSDRYVFRDGDFGGNTTAAADVIADFGDALMHGPFRTSALVPPMPWLDDRPPPARLG